MNKVYTIAGTVISGRQLGRTLGFPTANIEIPDDFSAPDGVYRARVEVEGQPYEAMANLGSNPTVGLCRRRLESHLFRFEGSLYGKTIRVTLIEKIRDERTFASVEELQQQLEQDKGEIIRRIENQ